MYSLIVLLISEAEGSRGLWRGAQDRFVSLRATYLYVSAVSNSYMSVPDFVERERTPYMTRIVIKNVGAGDGYLE